MKLLGREIEVIWNPKLDVHGVCHYDEFRIELNPKFMKTAKQTLFHELIHQALYMTGQIEYLQPDQEESIVLALENALAPFAAGCLELPPLPKSPSSNKKPKS